MGKFLNKNEVVILVLLLVIFDFNGFCDVSLQNIMYKDQRSIVAFILAFVFLAIDLYSYHVVSYSYPTPDSDYKPTKATVANSCDDFAKEAIENTNELANGYKAVCKTPANEVGYYYSQKMVNNFVALVLVFMVVICMAMSNGENVNSRLTRTLFALPIIIFACLLFLCTNILLSHQ